MALVWSRQSPTDSSSPPTFNFGQYQTVPLLNNRNPLIGLTVTFIVCSWICTLLRLYVRLVVQRAPGWDDFFLILTMLSTTLGSVVLCIMPSLGLGKPIFTLPLSELEPILKAIYIGTSTYPLSATFIKMALLLQYLRIFTGPRVRIFCKCVLVLTAVMGVAFAICTWFSCFPVAAFWDISIKNGRCWGFASRDRLEFMRIMVTQVVITATVDIVVFLIPAQLYFRSDRLRTTRISLIGLFVLGLCTIMCSLWRVGYVIKLSLADENSFDPTWDNPTVMGLASYESHLAAVCSALPVCWPVLKTTWNRIFVTYEVHVTKEYGVFPAKKAVDIEMRSVSMDRTLPYDPNLPPEGWEPFVGDETTGLGENETVVESLPAAKKPRTVRGLFRIDDRT